MLTQKHLALINELQTLVELCIKGNIKPSPDWLLSLRYKLEECKRELEEISPKRLLDTMQEVEEQFEKLHERGQGLEQQARELYEKHKTQI